MVHDGPENPIPQGFRTNRDFEDFLQAISSPPVNPPNNSSIIEGESKINHVKLPLLARLNSNSIEISRNPESDFISTHLDRFIRELPQLDSRFNQILSQLRRDESVLPVQPPPPEDRRNTFTSEYGLKANSMTAGRQLEITITVNGHGMVKVGDKYTWVNFIPGGRARIDRSKMTNSIASGIKGLTELIAAVDRGDVTLEPLFIGWTNINMALICQRLGFKIIDQCRKADGTIDKSQGDFIVVGKLEDIRQKLAEFIQSGLTERIVERDTRLRLKPQPA